MTVINNITSIDPESIKKLIEDEDFSEYVCYSLTDKRRVPIHDLLKCFAFYGYEYINTVEHIFIFKKKGG